MRGTTITAKWGQKPRRFDDILSEIAGFFVAHDAEGMWAGVNRPASGATTLGPVFGPLDAFRSKVIALDGFDASSLIADRPGVDEHHRTPHLLSCTKMLDGRTGGGAPIR